MSRAVGRFGGVVRVRAEQNFGLHRDPSIFIKNMAVMKPQRNGIAVTSRIGTGPWDRPNGTSTRLPPHSHTTSPITAKATATINNTHIPARHTGTPLSAKVVPIPARRAHAPPTYNDSFNFGIGANKSVFIARGFCRERCYEKRVDSSCCPFSLTLLSAGSIPWRGKTT
jgi:hypothetical protein